jgi:glycosyltransferase involved in cell wall biosynthesis
MDEDLVASVVICTRNRAASLSRTLASLVEAAELVNDLWELIVVDNGSTDDTLAIVEAFSDKLPIRWVFEPEAGLSRARNAGVRVSKGDFVLWTDDDVLVDRNWLRAWFDAFHDHPGDVIFGGRSEPVYEEPKQEWFIANQNRLRSLLAIRDEPEWDVITLQRVPYGLNYAIRGQEQRTHLYDPELGVAPGRRRGGEETHVVRQLLAEGASGRWVWGATVFHLIPADRQTDAYIRRFYNAHGYQFPVAGQVEGRMATVKASLSSFRKWTRATLSYSLKRRINHAASVPALIAASRASGSLRYYLGLEPD